MTATPLIDLILPLRPHKADTTSLFRPNTIANQERRLHSDETDLTSSLYTRVITGFTNHQIRIAPDRNLKPNTTFAFDREPVRSTSLNPDPFEFARDLLEVSFAMFARSFARVLSTLEDHRIVSRPPTTSHVFTAHREAVFNRHRRSEEPPPPSPSLSHSPCVVRFPLFSILL